MIEFMVFGIFVMGLLYECKIAFRPETLAWVYRWMNIEDKASDISWKIAAFGFFQFFYTIGTIYGLLEWKYPLKYAAVALLFLNIIAEIADKKNGKIWFIRADAIACTVIDASIVYMIANQHI